MGGRGTRVVTYCISCGEFLLCADDGSCSLSSVQGSLSSDDGLMLGGASGNFAPNFGNGIPVV
jgi:hypothetical protein